MIAREIMTPDPYTVSVTTNLRQVLRALREADVRHLPVVENDALVGIISDRDLRDVVPDALSSFASPGRIEEILARPASTLMTASVVSVNPETELPEVIDLMIENRVGAVPVVEADSSKLVGIVSYVERVARRARRCLTAPIRRPARRPAERRTAHAGNSRARTPPDRGSAKGSCCPWPGGEIRSHALRAT